jgi:hypothetical protein
MKMKDLTPEHLMIACMILFATSAILGISSWLVDVDRANDHAVVCHQKGGVWLHNERQCVKMEVIPVP